MKSVSILRASCVAVGLVTGVTHAISGQPGSFDLTFNLTGKVINPLTFSRNTVTALGIQSDGKSVLVGYCYNGYANVFCAQRYETNGTLDATFGSGGSVLTAVGLHDDDQANAFAMQPDGKLLLAGSCSESRYETDFCALRYHPDGTLDTSFGLNGKVITAISVRSERARAVALQPDGKIILAGGCINVNNSLDFCAARYLANGALDVSFGAGGISVLPVAAHTGIARALAMQTDGNVVLAGVCNSGTRDYFCTMRLHANGSTGRADGALDTDFATNGVMVTGFGSAGDAARSIALQPDGGIVVAGQCSNGGTVNFCALRLRSNGAFDTTFGTSGKVTTAVGRYASGATSVALQSDGRLLVAGTCSSDTRADICAIRYDAKGFLDTSFGTAGIVAVSNIGASDSASAMALQSDGKVVIAGQCWNGYNDTFCALRYDGGPFGYKACSLDIDGDNRVLATTDSLIHARIALGMTGSAVVNGISFPATATRTTWVAIRSFLVNHCGLSLPL